MATSTLSRLDTSTMRVSPNVLRINYCALSNTKTGQRKKKYLVDYLGRVLPSITTFYSAATGVNICTTDDGIVVHTLFEDTRDVPTLLDVQALNLCSLY